MDSVALDNELILFFGIFARVFLNVILWSMNLVHQTTDQNNNKLERSESVAMEMRANRPNAFALVHFILFSFFSFI